MKQMTCAQMGGPADCQVMIQGNDVNEITDNGMKHLQETHPEMAADMAKMTPEQIQGWKTDFQPKFDAHPEM